MSQLVEQVLARGSVLYGSAVTAPLICLREPLSFWGGVDARSGRIIDQRHPDHGTDLGGSALLMGAGRGSSSSASVILECVRNGTAPAALLLFEPDMIIAVGIAVGWELYGCGPTLLLLTDRPNLEGVTVVAVDDSGAVRSGIR